MFTLQGMKAGAPQGDPTTCAIQDLISAVNDLLLNQGCDMVAVGLATSDENDPAA